MRPPGPEFCNCLAVRQAARHVSQFYDRCLAPFGLKTSQFSVLARLARRGPMTINALAALMVMDRTTLGRNIQPLERDGLVAVATGAADRRSRTLSLTPKGAARLKAAAEGWSEAQARFEQAFGPERAQSLRALLDDVVTTEFAAG
jgi:DNA-binding MarR family transcriptional regulator